jgi:hypothetical protein
MGPPEADTEKDHLSELSDERAMDCADSLRLDKQLCVP